MASDSTEKNEIGRREFIGTAAAVGGVMFIPAGRVWGIGGEFGGARWVAGLRGAGDGGRYQPV